MEFRTIQGSPAVFLFSIHELRREDSKREGKERKKDHMDSPAVFLFSIHGLRRQLLDGRSRKNAMSNVVGRFLFIFIFGFVAAMMRTLLGSDTD
ncbi:hypothetical protein LZ31DRAFT_7063 [Colletotrichum somersetense]|nr:hypothetical protein LZ31DRAFT_7063 [Colletotrichum somersetense]